MWFDKLTTNGINKLPFVLSLSKDLIRGSLSTISVRARSRHFPPPILPFAAYCMGREPGSPIIQSIDQLLHFRENRVHD